MTCDFNVEIPDERERSWIVDLLLIVFLVLSQGRLGVNATERLNFSATGQLKQVHGKFLALFIYLFWGIETGNFR